MTPIDNIDFIDINVEADVREVDLRARAHTYLIYVVLAAPLLT